MKKDSQESIFLTEWLANGRPPNFLPISAVCNSRCIFCSNHLNPFPITDGIFRDVEDIKHQLSRMDRHKDPIQMSDSLPGRIAEGEAFLHPQIFKILELVRRKFVINKLGFNTNGSMLDKHFLKELSRFHPIQITLSMHSTRPELWARIFRRTETAARRAIQALEWMNKFHIELTGAIVPLPHVCGWEDIEFTYSKFASLGAKSIVVWWPGYTVRTPPDLVKELACPLDEFEKFVARMKKKHASISPSPRPDLRAPFHLPIKKIISHTLRGNVKTSGGPYRRVLWLVSEAAHSAIDGMIKEQAPSLPTRHHAFPVKNRTYGGNIIVAGLLMVEDFIRAGREAIDRWPDTELLLVPYAPFDSLYRDLKRSPAYRISDELNRPVWLVNEGGNFDPLLSPFLEAGDSRPAVGKRTGGLSSKNKHRI